nr:hypothetical protein [Moorena sp. SIOASIH]
MIKCIATLLLLLILSFAFAPPAVASYCRNKNNNRICILSIKRSAKYPWEYRASVSVNGVATPIEIYNCRNRIRVKKNRTVVPFQDNGPGELICSILNK